MARRRTPVCYRGRVWRAFRIVLAIAALTGPAAAADGGRTVSLYDGLVSLRVPSDWNEIPQGTLEYFSLRTAEATGGRVAEVYQHGFRPGDPQLSLSLPQLLIQIREDGRVPYGSFLRLPRPEEVAAPAGTALSDPRGSGVRDVRLTSLAFDADSYCLRVDSVLDLPFDGPTLVRSASFLTERGTFTLHFYDLEDRGTESAPLFEAMVASVRIDDRLAYRPRPLDRWSSRAAGVALFAVAALLAAVALGAQRRRAKRPGARE